MRSAFAIIARLLLILALPLVGAVLGFGLAKAQLDGRFEQWQPLGSPPEPALMLTARDGGVWAATVSGQWYIGTVSNPCSELTPCWMPASAPPDETNPWVLQPRGNCFPLPSLVGLQLVAVRCSDASLAARLDVFGVRPDGSVWLWQHSGDREYGPLIVFSKAVVLGAGCGLALTLGALTVLNYQKTNNQSS